MAPVILDGASLADCLFSGTNFAGGLSLVNATLDNVKFVNITVTGVLDARGASLAGVSFMWGEMKGGADLTGAGGGGCDDGRPCAPHLATFRTVFGGPVRIERGVWGGRIVLQGFGDQSKQNTFAGGLFLDGGKFDTLQIFAIAPAVTFSARNITCRILDLLGGTAEGTPSTLTVPLDMSGLVITAEEPDSQQALTVTDYIFASNVSMANAVGRLSRSGFAVMGVPLPVFRLQRLSFEAALDLSGVDVLLEAMTNVNCSGPVDFRRATLRSTPSTNFFGVEEGHSTLREVMFAQAPRWAGAVVDLLWLWAVRSPPFTGTVTDAACPASATDVEFFANTNVPPTCDSVPTFRGGGGGVVCGVVGPPFRTPAPAVPRFFC